MKKGIYFALTTALISGISIFASKIFVAKMDPIVYTTLKNGLVAIILTLIILTPKFKSKIKTLTKKDWSKLVLIGIVGGSIPFALFFTGLKMTESVNAALIHKTLFIWVAALAIPFLKEKLNVYQAIGYVLILLGVVAGSGLTFSGDRGEQLIFLATILWAVENVIAKVTLKHIPSEIVAWARMSFGLIVLLGIVAFQGHLSSLVTLTTEQITSLVIATILLTGYVLTWYKALKYAPATVVSSILVLSTPITALLSGAFSVQVLPSGFETGTLLTILGIVVITFFPTRKIVS